MANKFVRSFASSYNTSTSQNYVQRLCSSWLLPTWILFALRLLISIYAFATLFTRIGIYTTTGESHAAALSFSFFTNLGYWGLGFYFAFAAAHTASYAAKGRAWLENWPAVLRYMHSAFYATITVFPFIVTAVYWAVLSAGSFSSEISTWYNIS
jgi:hypothetical protein